MYYNFMFNSMVLNSSLNKCTIELIIYIRLRSNAELWTWCMRLSLLCKFSKKDFKYHINHSRQNEMCSVKRNEENHDRRKILNFFYNFHPTFSNRSIVSIKRMIKLCKSLCYSDQGQLGGFFVICLKVFSFT